MRTSHFGTFKGRLSKQDGNKVDLETSNQGSYLEMWL